MRKFDFKKVLARHPEYDPNVYIETGLWKGDHLIIAAECFKVVHGIELDDHWFMVSRKRVEKFPNVTVHHGDTREVLPVLLDRYPENPCFLYFDAHYCKTDPPIRKSEFPLWAELEKIKKRRTRDIVLVDDVHTFGKSRHELRFRPDVSEWERVTKNSLLEYFGGRVQDSLEIADSFIIWKDGFRNTGSLSTGSLFP